MRTHTTAEKAKAVGVALVSGTQEAAKAAGVSRRTVQRWVDDPLVAQLVAENTDTVRGHLYAGMQLALDAVMVGLKDPDVPLRDRVVAFGVLYDKHALMSGGATSRTESKDLTHDLDDHEAEVLGQVIRAELARRADGDAAEPALEGATPTGAETA